MKKILASIILVSLISCKKEVSQTENTDNKDSINTSLSVKDTISKKAETEVFIFQTELCDNKGYFDPSKYTKQELEGTLQVYNLSGTALLNTPAVFRVDALQEMKRDKNKILAELDADFSKMKNKLENLKVVNVPFWQNAQKELYQSLLDEYEKDKVTILGYSNPKELLNSKFSKTCSQYTDALAGTDQELFAEWKSYTEEKGKKNGDLETAKADFEQKFSSSQNKEFAIIALMIAWSNCANHSINHPKNDDKMYSEFNKLFIKIDADCDEP